MKGGGGEKYIVLQNDGRGLKHCIKIACGSGFARHLILSD